MLHAAAASWWFYSLLSFYCGGVRVCVMSNGEYGAGEPGGPAWRQDSRSTGCQTAPPLPPHSRLLVAGRSFTTAQTWCACKRWTTSLSSNRPCCVTGEGRRFIDARHGNELPPGAAAAHRTLPADSQARSGADVPWLVPLPATKPAGMRESTPVAQATAKMGWPPSGEWTGCVWVRRAAALRSRLTACALLHT